MGRSVKVLVTGHRGYLGTAIVSELGARGHDVSGLDKDLYKISPIELSNVVSRGVIPWIEKDIRDAEASDFLGFDAVVHLAGLSNDPLGALDPETTHAINHRAAVRCAAKAKEAGVSRFLFASSCSVYGASDDSVLAEQAEFAPVTAYAESKLRAETEIASMADAAFCPVFLRSGTVYGLTALARFDLVVNNLVAWAVATGSIRMKSDGSAWRPIVHVADVARAFAGVLVADRGAICGQAFNVAVPDGNMQICAIAKAIERAMPACDVTFAGEIDVDQRNYRVDGAKLASVLGANWFQYRFEEGLAELVTQLAGLALPVEAFEGARFQRLAHLKKRLEQADFGADLR